MALLGANPCAIPEKALRRELERCKKCLVFSGAEVVMRVQCAAQTRIIRSEILDKDMFDPDPHTPEHTSWTMQLLARLDRAVGPGVMERPVFAVSQGGEPARGPESITLRDLSLGKYDELFRKAKLSELYRATQNPPAPPQVRLLGSVPLQPQIFVQPEYPQMARIAHIEGAVVFKVEIDPGGNTSGIEFESGHPLFQASVKEAVGHWRFPRNASTSKIQAAIDFSLNCPSQRN